MWVGAADRPLIVRASLGNAVSPLAFAKFVILGFALFMLAALVVAALGLRPRARP